MALSHFILPFRLSLQQNTKAQDKKQTFSTFVDGDGCLLCRKTCHLNDIQSHTHLEHLLLSYPLQLPPSFSFCSATPIIIMGDMTLICAATAILP